ncbi:Uncharacterized conserved protein [Enhydrobacter aerosaccus]|uniref:Uncharacterized conserved protein n=1 Tax=Enhydrobacter aerosaccus TaxID=225324 RepID=A0A1T4TJ56_9HYPH|nr:DUF2285 domain-containing protein [Enhydrobacter aerosaccus]SKA40338.1 Uncharacterized conserved protein [Enhydrobacter aerosaccus]
MTKVSFDDVPPKSSTVTSYDERHAGTYLRLLDAESAGADWREVVMVLFGLDPVNEPERSRLIYDGHLARARWMRDSGFKHLLRPQGH